jgi:DTW domain-containing protein YfiP
MDVAAYQRQRLERESSRPRYRELCMQCLQPDFSCYCQWISPFDPHIDFVILIHPIEVQRRIATGRMAHLCLRRSVLLMGHDYSENVSVNEIVGDPSRHCVMLYPGRLSKNISPCSLEERHALFPKNKKLTLFVIDGTWATARKMVRLSDNLRDLPRICFTPPGPSNFRVRKQPRPECYSTIEAIHHTIDLLQIPAPDTERRAHDSLLYVFDRMVQRQIELQLTRRELMLREKLHGRRLR